MNLKKTLQVAQALLTQLKADPKLAEDLAKAKIDQLYPEDKAHMRAQRNTRTLSSPHGPGGRALRSPTSRFNRHVDVSEGAAGRPGEKVTGMPRPIDERAGVHVRQATYAPRARGTFTTGAMSEPGGNKSYRSGGFYHAPGGEKAAHGDVMAGLRANRAPRNEAREKLRAFMNAPRTRKNESDLPKAEMEKKQGVPQGVDPDKQERCVRDVKGSGAKNPYAVCNASLQGKTRKDEDCGYGSMKKEELRACMKSDESRPWWKNVGGKRGKHLQQYMESKSNSKEDQQAIKDQEPPKASGSDSDKKRKKMSKSELQACMKSDDAFLSKRATRKGESNPDKEADAKLGEVVEREVEQHFKENAASERKEGHSMAAKKA